VSGAFVVVAWPRRPHYTGHADRTPKVCSMGLYMTEAYLRKPTVSSGSSLRGLCNGLVLLSNCAKLVRVSLRRVRRPTSGGGVPVVEVPAVAGERRRETSKGERRRGKHRKIVGEGKKGKMMPGQACSIGPPPNPSPPLSDELGANKKKKQARALSGGKSS